MITMECLHCGELIKTTDVAKAVAFDREHAATCTPTTHPADQGQRQDAGAEGEL